MLLLNPNPRGLRALSLVLALMPALFLRAQVRPDASAAAEKESAIKLDAFKVTGTQIKRLEIEKVLPVTVFNQEAIEIRNPSTPVEMLTSMPQVTGQGITEGGGSPLSARGDAASINLRGIGAGNTLLLLDGLRMAPRAGILGNEMPNNVNALPSRGLDRIDVLRDGASASYGSDAVAGVVNYITKRDYVGTELILRGGLTEHGGGETGEIVLTNGTTFAGGKGNLLSTWSYMYRESIEYVDRPFAANDNTSRWARAPWNAPAGPYDLTSSTGLWPTFRVGTSGSNTYLRPINGVPILTNIVPDRVSSPEYYMNNAQFGNQPRTDRLSLYEKATYKVTERLTAFADYYIYSANSPVHRNPMFSSNSAEGRQRMAAGNPYNPFGANFYSPTGAPNPDGTTRLVGTPQDIFISDYLLPGYPRETIDSRSQIYRIATGLRGKYAQTWNWDVAGVYSASTHSDIDEHNVYIPTYQLALARTDATAYNPFRYTFKVDNGRVVTNQAFSNPQSVLKQMEAPFHQGGFSGLAGVVARADGELFTVRDHTVSLAVGTEYRKEHFTQVRQGLSLPDQRTFLGASANPDCAGGRTIFSVYAESVIPLFAPKHDVPLFNSLELTAAGRYENYSDFGGTTNPKVGVNWKPATWLMVRASGNKGYRAPPLPALYRGQNTATSTLTDPYRSFLNEGSVPTNNTTGSNPKLQPELSKGRTAGVVVDVPFVKGLSLAVDYWQIDQSALLGSFAGNDILLLDVALIEAYTRQQMAAGTKPDQIDIGSGTSYKGDPRMTRIPLTDPDRAAFAAWNATHSAAQQKAPAGRPFNTKTLTENRSTGYASGIDVGLNYVLPALPLGRFTLSSNAAYFIDSYTVADAGGVRSSRMKRAGAARLRGDASVFWRKGSWNAGFVGYYVGDLLNTGASTTAAVYESLGRPSYIAVENDQGRTLYFDTIRSTMTYNANVGYSFRSDSRWLKNTKVRVTINNLFDKKPELPAGYSAAVQQNLLSGRALSVETSKQF